MFHGATKFNQPLGKWDVHSVKVMGGMFAGAASFNQPLDKWDVARVEDINFVFAGAASFEHRRPSSTCVSYPPPPPRCAQTRARTPSDRIGRL
jgi:hypothetical protein